MSECITVPRDRDCITEPSRPWAGCYDRPTLSPKVSLMLTYTIYKRLYMWRSQCREVPLFWLLVYANVGRALRLVQLYLHIFLNPFGASKSLYRLYAFRKKHTCANTHTQTLINTKRMGLHVVRATWGQKSIPGKVSDFVVILPWSFSFFICLKISSHKGSILL